ncbi:DUF3048 domain-containing protein [Streptomyces sp. SID5785]|uniref:DUF3048 domain-containing protein n=1 Tax=Streptomyces sp. SID5785 TaxID=2690309 RepID=UPI001360D1EA|nr:DUF3048 domain-containing protein [Streptomyces sp. SID5785]MZD08875.1 DUF3048 domain-containing protein [Streptomyces sp. SID5785]
MTGRSRGYITGVDILRRRAVVAGLLAALLAACTPAAGPPDGGESSATPSRTPSAGAALLAVKIDNVGPARPQTGLEDADLVYAEQVEGGLSRLMALYGTRAPRTVGPVRSARETDLELLGRFDRPTLAFSGAQSALLPAIEKAPLRAVTPGEAEGAFFRGSDRPAPHNLYLRPGKLGRTVSGTNAGTLAGYRFAARRPDGGRPVTERTVRFPAARFTFSWSDAEHRWRVAMDGRAAVTAGGARLEAATVVVQYVQVRDSRLHDKLGNASPLSRTVGAGRAEVLRDGRSYPARWQRPTAADGTAFTAADGGAPLPFAPGPVWVVLAKA